MGLDEGRFELNSPNGTYYSGQTVQGKLIFQQDKVKSFRGIYVKLKGFCYVHWETRRSKTVNGKKEYYTVSHSAHEEYINYKVFLVGGESGEHSIGPGDYGYPFRFRLPDNCPASFEGQYGHVRYEITAVVDEDEEKKIAVRVMAPVDLNLDPYCREPLELHLEETYCSCCIRSGVCDVSVKLPVAGYCPGQTIPIELVCANNGRLEIKNIKLSIVQQLIYVATQKAARKTCGEVMVEIKKGPIPARTNRNWTVDMEVPAMNVYDLTGCQYIKLDYKFKVVVNPKGCHADSEDSCRIVIGTVPLVGYQDNVPNPLQDQLPMINAYPEDNPPFPNPQSYPENANPLYPNITPYRDNPPPYPGNLTDPTSNPSYPSVNPPYPDEKSPFLGANSPSSGFTAPSGGSGLPTSPPNNSGSLRPPSPYAAASAPASDTSDVLPEKKE